MNKRLSRPTRYATIGATLVSAASLGAFIMIPGENPVSPAIGIGLESVSPDTDWTALRQQFDEHEVRGFSISVGRPEWKAVPVGDPDDWAPAASTDGDIVAEAIRTLSEGSDRAVVTTIDALSPRWNEDDPSLAGRFADGSRAPDFPSATSLYSGPVGDGIEELCRSSAQRYSPDRVAVTELIGDTFFSRADENLYRQMTGEAAFPRRDNGDVDVNDDTLNDWQSQIIISVVTRCQEAAKVPVEIDVRVNWEDPGANRHDSGHRYDDLLAAGAHLNMWAYTGIAGVDPGATGSLVSGLEKRFSSAEMDRISVSVGLWGGGGEILNAAAVSRSLNAVGDDLPVLLTPLALMSEEHWAILPPTPDTSTTSSGSSGSSS